MSKLKREEEERKRNSSWFGWATSGWISEEESKTVKIPTGTYTHI